MWHYSVEISVEGINSKKVIGRVQLPRLKEGRKEYETYELLYYPCVKIELLSYSGNITIYPGSSIEVGCGSIQYYENTEVEGEEYVQIKIGEMLI